MSFGLAGAEAKARGGLRGLAVVSADVPVKTGESVRRDPEKKKSPNEPVGGHRAQDTLLKIPPGRGGDTVRQHHGLAAALQSANEVEVLENRPIFEAVEVFEGTAGSELCLVAQRSPGQEAAHIYQALAEAKNRLVRVEANAESSTDFAFCDGLTNAGHCFIWQAGVGMQKKESVGSAGCSCSAIQLWTAAGAP